MFYEFDPALYTQMMSANEGELLLYVGGTR